MLSARVICCIHLLTLFASESIEAICMGGSGGGGGWQGVPTPLKNHKNLGFLSITGPDPMKNHKLPSQNSMLGHHRHASETPRHLNG